MTTPDLFDFASSTAVIGLALLTAALARAWPGDRASRYRAVFFALLATIYLVSTIVTGCGDALTANALRWLHAVNVPAAYVFGPLLLGYATELTLGKPLPASRVFRHLSPALAVFVFSFGNAVFGWDRTVVGHGLFRATFDAWTWQGLPYFILVILRTRDVGNHAKPVEADEIKSHTAWLRGLAAVMIFVWTLAAIERLPVMPTSGPWVSFDVFLGMLITTALYFLVWFGLRQRILLPASRVESASGARLPSYARSGLDAAQCATIAADLEGLMTRERLYADEALDLHALSRRSNWPPNYISQALSQGLQRNFFEFVNGYRVAAAQRCLADSSDRRAILDIALACGFGSKSTFNTVFKRVTGVTPGEFRRSAR